MIKAYRYMIEINTGSSLVDRVSEKEKIEEVAIPELGAFLNKYGVFFSDRLDSRMCGSEFKKEIKISKSYVVKIQRLKKAKGLESRVIDSFKLKKI